MLEIIALIFLTRKNGATALRKGLKPGAWKLYTVLAWFAAEIIGFIVGALLIGQVNLLGLMVFGFVFAFGGFLAIKYILDKKPDTLDEEVNRIGTEDLRP